VLILLTNVSFFLKASFPPGWYGLIGWVDEREKGKFQDLHRSIKVCLRGLENVPPGNVDVCGLIE
jgi:hypothetical protein